MIKLIIQLIYKWSNESVHEQVWEKEQNTKPADCLASHKDWKCTATSSFIITFYEKKLLLPGKLWERSPAVDMDLSPHAMQFTEIPSRRHTLNETSDPSCCECDTGVQLKLVTAPLTAGPVYSIQVRPLFRWSPPYYARTNISERQEMGHHLLWLFKYQILSVILCLSRSVFCNHCATEHWCAVR